jgi:hypothetical protein
MIYVSAAGVKYLRENKCGCFASIKRKKVIKRKRKLLKKWGWLMNHLKNYRLTAVARAARGIELLLDIEHLALELRVVVDSLGHLFIGIADSGRAPVA